MRWAYKDPSIPKEGYVYDFKTRILPFRCCICLDKVLNETMRAAIRFREINDNPNYQYNLYVCMACALSHADVRRLTLECSESEFSELISKVNKANGNMVFETFLAVCAIFIVGVLLAAVIKHAF